MTEETCYAGRSARDRNWRQTQIAGAMEREGQRRAEDPAGAGLENGKRRAASRSKNFWLRVGGDRGSLWRVLRNEVRRGRIDYHYTTKRYVLNGGLPADLRQALLRIGLVDDRR